jgi:hypothetical protein
MIKKVSVDFDLTLSEESVQVYIRDLVKRGIIVWIVTARYDDKQAGNTYQNADLYRIAKKVGIPIKHIKFMNMVPKWKFIRNEHFIWHLDDDNFELQEVARNTKTKAIDVKSGKWLGYCEKFLR